MDINTSEDSDQNKEDKMDGICGWHGTEAKRTEQDRPDLHRLHSVVYFRKFYFLKDSSPWILLLLLTVEFAVDLGGDLRCEKPADRPVFLTSTPGPML
jgi:hypothetical protein